MIKLPPFRLLKKITKNLFLLSLFSFFTFSLIAQDNFTLVTGGPSGVATSVVGAGNGSTVYAGFGASGVYKSTDNGLNWTAVNSGLTDSSGGIISPRSLYRLSSGRIIRGGDTGSWNNKVGSPIFYSDDGTSWIEATYPFNSASKGPGGTVSFINFTEHNSALFASDLLGNGVWKSSDNGATWSDSSIGIPPVSSYLAFQRTDGIVSQGNALIAIILNHGVYRSSDNGATWQLSKSGVGNKLIVDATGSAAYAILDKLVYKTTDGGLTWSIIGGGLIGLGNIFGPAESLAFTNGKLYVHTFAGLGFGKIAESSDGGISWTELASTGLTSNPQGLEVTFYASNNALYVATSSGLFRTDLLTATRIPISPSITNLDNQTVNINIDFPFSFTADVIGTNPITWIWKKDGVVISSATTQVLSILTVSNSDAGVYSATATNSTGSDSISFTLAIQTSGLGDINYSFKSPILTVYNYFYKKINKLLILPNGKLWVGGVFSKINDIARFQSVVLDELGNVDTSYDSSNRYTEKEITSVFRQKNGKFLITYPYYKIHGVAGNPFTDDYFTRLTGTGDWDETFQMVDNSATIFFSNSTIYSSAEGPNGKIYAAGKFSRGGILRFFPDGTLDSSWADGTITSYNKINKVIALPDGKVLIAGNFTKTRGNSSHKYFARLNNDGSLDTSFNPAINTYVLIMYLQKDGKILVAGTNYLKRFNSDGTEDFSVSFSGTPTDIAVQKNGKILLGGSVSGLKLVRYNTDGTLDTTFTVASSITSVNSIAIHPGGDIFVTNGTEIDRIFGDPVDLDITGSPQDISVNRGEAITLSVQIYTTSSANYQWRKDGVNISGANSATYTILTTVDADSGSYDVVVTNSTSSETSESATLTILGLPSIQEQPKHSFFVTGDTFTLSVKAIGGLPLSYQWKKDGVDLSGETSASLTITNGQSANLGNYTVLVSNTFGSIESNIAVATLIPDPTAEISTLNLGSKTGGIASVFSAKNGGFYIIGDFTSIGGVTRNGLAKLNADGSLDTSFIPDTNYFPSFSYLLKVVEASDGSVYILAYYVSRYILAKLDSTGNIDTTFDAGIVTTALGFIGIPSDIGIQKDGKIVVVGAFNAVNGDTSKKYIVRYNTDGSVDTEFSPASISSLSSYYTPTEVKILSDNRILLIGSFTILSGTSNKYIVILKTDGSIDTSFDVSKNQPSTINSVIEEPSGKIVIVNSDGISRFNIDGSLDTSFSSPIFSSSLQNIAYHPNGLFLVAGYFTSVNSQVSYYLSMVDINGNVVSEFSSPTTAKYASNIAISKTGTIFLSGIFTSYNGNAREGITILNGIPITLAITNEPMNTVANPTDSVIFSALATSIQTINYQWQKDSVDIAGANSASLTLSNVSIADNGNYRLIASNSFGQVISKKAYLVVKDAPVIVSQPISASTSLKEGGNVSFSVKAIGANTVTYQWQKDGVDIVGANSASLNFSSLRSADTGNYVAVIANSLGTITSDTVSLTVVKAPAGIDYSKAISAFPNLSVMDVVFNSNGDFFVAGSFTNGTNSYLTKYLADGSLDASFVVGTTINGSVYKVLALSNGKILIGGSFSIIGSVNLKGIARLNADGSLDTTFTPPSTMSGRYGIVTIYDIDTQIDGKIVIVGNFSTIDGTATQAGIVRLNTDGTYDASLSVGYGFMTGTSPVAVRAVSILPDGRILVGGDFTSFDSISMKYLAMLKSDGSLDSSFTPSLFTARVYSIFQTHDNKLLIGGAFANYSGTTNSYIIKLNLDGSLDTTFTTEVLLNSIVYDAKETIDGKSIIATGSFSGNARNRIVVFNSSDGTVDNNFNTTDGFNSTVESFDIMPSGKIIAGGTFTSYESDTSYAHLVALNGLLVDLAIVDQPVNVDSEAGTLVNFTVNVYSDSTESYQWQKDGVDVIGATTNTLNLSSISISDEGLYSVIVSNSTTIVTSDFVRLRILASPIVDIQPVNQSINVGESLKLSAKVLGASPLTFQWYQNGQAIQGATSLDLSIPVVSSVNAGFYYLTATNNLGSVTTDTVSVNINFTAGNAPALSISALTSNFTVTTGEDANLEVISIGESARTYQWYMGLSGDTSSSILSATSAIYTHTNLQSSSDFWVRITDSLGTVDSNTISIAVISPPVITIVSALINIPLNDATPNILDGVSASDYLSVDLTSSVVTSGDIVDTTTQGVYTVLYDVQDSGSRNAVQKSRVYSVYESKGDIDPIFDTSSGSDGAILAVKVQDDSKVLLGGSFSYMNNTITGPLARLNTDYSLDSTFHTTTNTGEVRCVELTSDKKIYVGGDFKDYASSGNDYIVRLNSDGTIDEDFDVATKIDNAVDSFVELPTGRVIIGGKFQMNGMMSKPFLQSIRSNGKLDMLFNRNGSGPNGRVRKVVLQADGKILIAGDFTSYNNTPVNRVARINASGSLDTSFAPPSGANDVIYALKLQKDGKILVGGKFTSFNSMNTSLVRLNTDGTTDSTFGDIVLNANSAIKSLAIEDSGKILFGGNFSSVNGSAKPFLNRVLSGGESDYQFMNLGLSDEVRALDIKDRQIYTGGKFKNAGLQSLKHFTVLKGDPVLSFKKPFSNRTGSNGGALTLHSNGSGEGLAYQWFKDGVLLTGETGKDLLLTSLSLSSAGNYTAKITNALGTVESLPSVVKVATTTPFPFTSGWNMITIPFTPVDNSAKKILSDGNGGSLNSSNIWQWNPVEGNYTHVDKLIAGKAYWTYITSPNGKKLDLIGDAPEDTTLVLELGWNMIGAKGNGQLANIPNNANIKGSIWYWNGTSYKKVLDGKLKRYQGYWIYVDNQPIAEPLDLKD